MTTRASKKCCGTCKNHNTYDYPATIFCFEKLGKHEQHIRHILSVCGDWTESIQNCACLLEYIRAGRKTKPEDLKKIYAELEKEYEANEEKQKNEK